MKLDTTESFLAGPGSALKICALAVVCGLVASCASTRNNQATSSSAASPEPATADAATTYPDASQQASAVEPIDAGSAPAPGNIEQVGRTIEIGRFAETAPRVQVQGDDTIALNLEQEDLRRVFEQLGDALQLNMIIDPAINSVVSVRTTEDNPLTFDDIWPLMRLLAREAGVTIEQAGNVWMFEADDAEVPTEIVMPGWLSSAGGSEVLQVTPLKYISRETAAQLLAPLIADDGSIIALGARNLIGISGPAGMLTRVNALLEVIDDDPFQNQGIKLYRLQFTQASEVSEELDGILELIEGEAGVYQVLGLARINSVLVVGSPERGFDEVDRWVRVLDSESQEQVEQLFFYSVKNLDAVSLAETLTNVFGEPEDDEANVAAANQDQQQGAVIVAQQPVVGPPGLVAAQVQAPAAAAGGDGGVSADLSVSIVADEDTNSLLIRSSPRDYRQLLTMISRLDTPPKQVMINAVIAQATLSEGSAYGVDWARVSQNLGSGPARLSSNFLPSGLFTEAGDPTPGSGLVLTRTFSNGSSVIDATLNAIAMENEVKLLARPTLMATNNQEGEIIVGQEIPVDSGASVAGNGVVTSNIAYRDVGIVLTITPHINEDGFVNMEIFQSLSSVDSASFGDLGNPSFTNQEITTTAVVGDGSVIALGGLIQEDITRESNGIPGLRKIPGLGALFSYRSNNTVRRELFVILRPEIINPATGNPAAEQEFRERFERLKSALDDFWQ